MDKMRTGKTKSSRQPTTQTPQTSKKPGHKATHEERPIPIPEPTDRAEILPTTHIDDDPESYRLT